MKIPEPDLRIPFPGLRPFHEKDSRFFFGRESQSNAMLALLEENRFLAVVGSSGSGKSSMVRAGVIPAIRRGFLLGRDDWIPLVVRPGHHPFHHLANAILSHGREGEPIREEELSNVLELLQESELGFLHAVSEYFPGEGEAPVLLVVDQFEELFGFRARTGESASDGISRDEAAAFVSLLLRSVNDASSRVWIVTTMRSDFIGDCEAFLGLPAAVSKSQFLVPRLNRSQMEASITRPGFVKGADFAPFTIEESLVTRIINEAGDRPDQLPLMQHALMRTWKKATKRVDPSASLEEPYRVEEADYEEACGIEGALSDHADIAYESLEEEKKEIARRLMLSLCDYSSDGQITRRRPKVEEVLELTGVDLASLEDVIRTFQRDERNFLLPSLLGPGEHLSEEDYLDISHEALLRRWGIYQQWIREEREAVSELRRLREQAEFHRTVGGSLISAKDMPRVQGWRKAVNSTWAKRYLSDPDEWEEVEKFIRKSSEAIQKVKRQWIVAGTTLAAFVLATGAALLVLNLNSTKAKKDAQESAEKAQERLIENYVNVIGVDRSDTNKRIGAVETATLWELAALEKTDRFRKHVETVQLWDERGTLANGAVNESAGFRAVLGLSSRRKEESELQGKLSRVIQDGVKKKVPLDGDFVILAQSMVRHFEPDLNSDKASLVFSIADYNLEEFKKLKHYDPIPEKRRNLFDSVSALPSREGVNKYLKAPLDTFRIQLVEENDANLYGSYITKIGGVLVAVEEATSKSEKGTFYEGSARDILNLNKLFVEEGRKNTKDLPELVVAMENKFGPSGRSPELSIEIADFLLEVANDGWLFQETNPVSFAKAMLRCTSRLAIENREKYRRELASVFLAKAKAKSESDLDESSRYAYSVLQLTEDLTNFEGRSDLIEEVALRYEKRIADSSLLYTTRTELFFNLMDSRDLRERKETLLGISGAIVKNLVSLKRLDVLDALQESELLLAVGKAAKSPAQLEQFRNQIADKIEEEIPKTEADFNGSGVDYRRLASALVLMLGGEEKAEINQNQRNLLEHVREEVVDQLRAEGFRPAVESERLYGDLSQYLTATPGVDSDLLRNINRCYLAHAFTAIRLSEKTNSKVERICRRLSIADLVNILKWPLCVGEKEELVLSELERKMKLEPGVFKGNAWKFVEYVESIQSSPSKDPSDFGLTKNFRDKLFKLDLHSEAVRPSKSDWEKKMKEYEASISLEEKETPPSSRKAERLENSG